jgi:Cytosol aminopeptidase family, N-terminal domain
VELRFIPPDLGRLDELSCEVLACGVFSDERPPHGAGGLLDWRLSGTLSRLMLRGFVTGAIGEVVMIPLRPKLPFDKGLLFGLGAKSQFGDGVFRATVAHMLRAMEGLCARSAVVELPGRHAGAIAAEDAADVLLELAGGRPEHDVWTLIEPNEDQKRITARMIEQRRRDRRVTLGDIK